jgi:hypothetical protein
MEAHLRVEGEAVGDRKGPLAITATAAVNQPGQLKPQLGGQGDGVIGANGARAPLLAAMAPDFLAGAPAPGQQAQAEAEYSAPLVTDHKSCIQYIGLLNKARLGKDSGVLGWA